MNLILMIIVFCFLIFFCYGFYVNNVINHIISAISQDWKNENEIGDRLIALNIPTSFWIPYISFNWKFFDDELEKLFKVGKFPLSTRIELHFILDFLTISNILEDRVFEKRKTYDDISSKNLLLLRKIAKNTNSKNEILASLNTEEQKKFTIAEKKINDFNEIRIEKNNLTTKELKWRKIIIGKRVKIFNIFKKHLT